MEGQNQRLGRTAKEIAAEIGDELIKVKQTLAHGKFKPWVGENCYFSYRRAAEYMQVAKMKSASCRTFEQADSIRDVLDHKALKSTPKQELRAATLDDLRKVERLRALRDSPFYFHHKILTPRDRWRGHRFPP